jgi:hypothetical protein
MSKLVSESLNENYLTSQENPELLNYQKLFNAITHVKSTMDEISIDPRNEEESFVELFFTIDSDLEKLLDNIDDKIRELDSKTSKRGRGDGQPSIMNPNDRMTL